MSSTVCMFARLFGMMGLNCAIKKIRARGDASALTYVPSWSRGKLPLSGGLGRSVFCLGVAVLDFSFFSPHRPHSYSYRHSTWSYRYRSSEQISRDSDAMELWDEEQGDWTSTRVDYGELLNEKKDPYEPTLVNHPFSHREFQAMAQKLVIPPMVLDLMLKGKDRDYSDTSTRRPGSTWKPIPAPARPNESSRDQGRAADRNRSRSPAPRTRTRSRAAKKETTWTGKMGGVRDHTPKSPPPMRPSRGFRAAVGRGVGGVQVGGATSSMKPKISGRGRALSLRMRAEKGGAPLRKPGQPVSP